MNAYDIEYRVAAPTRKAKFALTVGNTEAAAAFNNCIFLLLKNR